MSHLRRTLPKCSCYSTQHLACGESLVASALLICPLKSILGLLRRFWSELFFRVPDMFFFKNKQKKKWFGWTPCLSCSFQLKQWHSDLSAQGMWLETWNGTEIHAIEHSSSANMWKIMVLFFPFSKHWVIFSSLSFFVCVEGENPFTSFQTYRQRDKHQWCYKHVLC